MNGCVCENMPERMKECMGMFIWFPGILLVTGIVLFLVGYLLDAAVIRILWLAGSGLLVFVSLLMCLAMIAFRKGQVYKEPSHKTA